MNILIIDNEEAVRVSLRNQLNRLVPGIVSIHEANGVNSGIESINTYKPDLIFLDVEMDDGTGFDLTKKLPEYNFQLVFITAHDRYAVKAFKLSAIDFLLKPIDDDELVIAINKAKENIKRIDLDARLEILQNSLQNVNINSQKIVLHDSKSMYFIKVFDICSCCAEGSYTTFFVLNHDKIVVSKPIKEYEQILEPMGFIRTHHSWLVNKNRITRFDKTDGGSLILENGQVIPVSQRKRDAVLEFLSKKP